MSAVETFRFGDDGVFPNSVLPLVVYRGALPRDAAAIERRFAGNGWSGGWRNGIFRYHHFHPDAHEVLGIAAGEARVMFGGPGGQEVVVRAGDVVVIPAGVAHRNMGQSADLLVVGAYPGGADYDTLKGEAREYDAAVLEVAKVGVPESDPVEGKEGVLVRLWKEAG